MRIIAGECRGMRLKTLPGEDTRPTLERVKEGMFSAVQNWLPGARVLDLYAGSGQLGLEALSRGAGFCVFVDSAEAALRVVRQNAEATGMSGKCLVQRAEAEAFVARCHDRFDLILLDPPYAAGALPALLERLTPLCSPGAVVLCEAAAKTQMPGRAGGLALQKSYRYGTVQVLRYGLTHPADEEAGR